MRTDWGASGWIFIHSICHSLPNEELSFKERTAVHDLLMSLIVLLPCDNCKIHWEANIRGLLSEGPMSSILQSRTQLCQTMNALHNEVNVALNKPTVTYEKACDMFDVEEGAIKCALPKRAEVPRGSQYLVVTIALLLLLVVVFMMNRRRG